MSILPPINLSHAESWEQAPPVATDLIAMASHHPGGLRDCFDDRRRSVDSEKDALFLRILKPGDFRYEGADLGVKQNFAARHLTTTQAFADPPFKIL